MCACLSSVDFVVHMTESTDLKSADQLIPCEALCKNYIDNSVLYCLMNSGGLFIGTNVTLNVFCVFYIFYVVIC